MRRFPLKTNKKSSTGVTLVICKNAETEVCVATKTRLKKRRKSRRVLEVVAFTTTTAMPKDRLHRRRDENAKKKN
jgi:hypothetical protein